MKLATLGACLGSVDSLIQHPAMPPAEREAMGISDGLVRFSVGIENAAGIFADLENRLNE